MHETPVNMGPGKGLDHIESIAHRLTLNCKRLFSRLEHVTTRSYSSNFTVSNFTIGHNDTKGIGCVD